MPSGLYRTGLLSWLPAIEIFCCCPEIMECPPFYYPIANNAILFQITAENALIPFLFQWLFLNSNVGFILHVLLWRLYVCTELRDFLWEALFLKNESLSLSLLSQITRLYPIQQCSISFITTHYGDEVYSAVHPTHHLDSPFIGRQEHNCGP